MRVDIFGHQSEHISITNWFDGFAILFPALVTIGSIVLTVTFYFGLLPNRQIRGKLTVVTTIGSLLLLSTNYHIVFGRDAITDWISRWLGEINSLAILMIHIELLKSFLVLGSPITKVQLNYLLFAVSVLYIVVCTGILRFIPHLGSIPPEDIVEYYNTLQSVFVAVIISLETLVLFHLVQLIIYFTKFKRVRTHYTPIQVRKIIWIALLGNSGSWIAIMIYVLKVDDTYHGYCWANIAGAFGMSPGIAVPFIFHILSRKKPEVIEEALRTQFHLEPDAASTSFPIVSVPVATVPQEAHALTLLDSPGDTPTGSQYANLFLRISPFSSRKPSPMNHQSLVPTKIVHVEQKINPVEP
jgi:hypothetical protein